jgi:8-oxo-dGTP pyrophosphatase MutT (NUDIX family)
MEDTYHLGIKALLTNSNGQVLLLKVNPARLKGAANTDYWDLPGGRVQKGQTVAETLEREVEEELGVRGLQHLEPVGMVLSNIRIPQASGDVGLILGVYRCTLPEGATLQLSAEHIASQWFSKTEAAKLLTVKYPPEFCELLAKM